MFNKNNSELCQLKLQSTPLNSQNFRKMNTSTLNNKNKSGIFRQATANTISTHSDTLRNLSVVQRVDDVLKFVNVETKDQNYINIKKKAETLKMNNHKTASNEIDKGNTNAYRLNLNNFNFFKVSQNGRSTSKK